MIKGFVLEKMALIKSFDLNRYDSIGLLIDQYQQGKLVLVSQEDRDRYSFQDPYNLMKKEPWGTYEKCRNATVFADGTVSISIWNGDNLHGFPTKLKFIARFKGFTDFSLFENTIDSYFLDFLKSEKAKQDNEKERKELERIAHRLLTPTSKPKIG